MKTLLEDYEDIVKRVSTNDIQSEILPPMTKAQYQNKITDNCAKLKEAGAKKVLLNIYMQILPLDDEYKNGHRGILKGDVDSLLNSKSCNAYTYFRDAAKNTQAPLLEYIVRCLDTMGDMYMEEAEERQKENEENNINIPPEDVNPDNEEDIDNALVDINTDDDYESFVNNLKKQTIDKIVSDITELINSEDQDKNMQFNTSAVSESAAQVAISYLSAKQAKDPAFHEITQDDMIGLAIRESVIYEIDHMFKQARSSFQEYTSRVKLGKSIVLERAGALPAADSFFA